MTTATDALNKIAWPQLVQYDQNSPTLLVWKTNYTGKSGRLLKRAGDIAGSLCKGSYSKIYYNGASYLIHRVIWFLFFGALSSDDSLDHEDGDISNNSIENLKVCTQADNTRNARKRKDNTTGKTGVFLLKTKSGHEYYMAYWRESGKYRRKLFSVGKLGREEAFKRACEIRAAAITSLIEQGLLYTKRHGT